MARTVHTTACPRNCYSTCGMRVTVEDGRLRTIAAHAGNDATSEGVCLKGQSYVERVYAADRLLHPLRRTGATFERIGWGEALDTIARRLVDCRERHGAQSVFFYNGSGTKGLLNAVSLDFWRLFGGCTTIYGDLCWPAGLEATRLTLGDNKHNAPADLANARLIVLWGKNAAETNIHQMRFVDQARSRGARVVVVDPRRTQTAEAADWLLRPRPGSDGALALGVAHRLIARGAVDRSFVDRHVLGFDAFAALAAEWPADRAATVADVDAADVERLADEIASCAPVSICAGYGMQRYTNSAQTMRAILALLAITGNVGKPGAGWIFANLQSDVFSAVKDPLALYPPGDDGPGNDPVRVSVSTALLGRHMLEQRDPPLTVAWVERGNPVAQNPQTEQVLRAFRALDFRVVVDQFLTDTAREADIVLPAKTMFEQTDVIGAYWHAYLQIKQKLIEPPGEVKPETEIYRLLAERLALPADAVAARIPGPGDAAIEAWLERRLARFPNLTLDALREAPQLAPGHEAVAFADLVFPTPSGRIELVSREAAERWGADPLPRWREIEEAPGRGEGAEYPLWLLTPNTKDRIHSQFNNLPSIRRLSPRPFVALHPSDAAARGIGPGERVVVFNARGRLTLEARLDHGLRSGCVAITNGWWLSEGGGVNLLSAARETDMAHGAAFHDNAVEVATV